MQIDSALVCAEEAIAVWRRAASGAWSLLGRVHIDEPGRDSILTALCAELVERSGGRPQTKLVLPLDDVTLIPLERQSDDGDPEAVLRAVLAARGLGDPAALVWDVAASGAGAVVASRSTIDTARRFFRERGIDPVAVVAPATDLMEREAVLLGPAAAATAGPGRATARKPPSPPVGAPVPRPARPALAEVPPPPPDIAELPQFAPPARRGLPLPALGVAGLALAMTVGLAIWVLGPGGGDEPDERARVVAAAPDAAGVGAVGATPAEPAQASDSGREPPVEPESAPAPPRRMAGLDAFAAPPSVDAAPQSARLPEAAPGPATLGAALSAAPNSDVAPATGDPMRADAESAAPRAPVAELPVEALRATTTVAPDPGRLGVFQATGDPAAPPEIATRLDPDGIGGLSILSLRPPPAPDAGPARPGREGAAPDPATAAIGPTAAILENGVYRVAIRPPARPARIAQATPPPPDNPGAVAVAPRPPDRAGDIARQIERRRAAAATMRPETPPPAAPPAAAAAPVAAAPRNVPQTASVAAAATEDNELAMNRLTLIGILGTQANRAALVRSANGEITRVTINDTIGGGRVVAIGDQSLSYVRNGRTRTLEMP
jgi:stage V sporulation protein SpoVS